MKRRTFIKSLGGVSLIAVGALLELCKAEELSLLGKMATESTALNVYSITVIGVALLALMIYLGLWYLTFLYQWKMRQVKTT